MQKITIYYWNNYYDRKYKSLDGIAAANIIYTESNGFNFNPSDSIDTSITLGRQTNPYNDAGNYAVIWTVDDSGKWQIESAWFILDSTRERSGQYTLQLHRDVVAEYWDELQTSTAFIEKATLPSSNPLIYNQEDMTFNQIKQGPDYLIKDGTNIPWIVGYFTTGEIMEATTPVTKADIELNSLSDDIYYDNSTSSTDFTPLKSPVACGFELACYIPTTNQKPRLLQRVTTNSQYNNYIRGASSELLNFNRIRILQRNESSYDFTEEIISAVMKYDGLSDFSKWGTFITANGYINLMSPEEEKRLIASQNQIIYVADSGKYYKRKVTLYDGLEESISGAGIASQIFNSYVIGKKIWNNQVVFELLNETQDYLGIYAASFLYRVDYIEQQGTSLSLNIDSQAKKLADAPYSMFAMPYGELDVYNGSNFELTTSAADHMNMASEITRKYSAGEGKIIYDLQLVPYCPLQNLIQDDGRFNVANAQTYYLKDNAGNKKGICLIAQSASFLFNVIKNIPLINKKIENQTEIYRVVSPNYDGQFEFNIAKNNGLKGFNIWCTYKPYQPYIQVSPIFENLYGLNYGDARGLICGGDFSLPVLSNAWESYQLSNKNYQRIFNREIENMEVNNRITNEQRRWEIVAGTVQAAGIGAAAGAQLANPVVGAVAGIGAAGLSLAGGIRDYQLAVEAQKESIDYKTDLFGYNLGNIKALPNSLTKVSAYVATNKIFPFLEHYTCTEEEKKAFAQKIAWNGMSVGVIGIIGDYLSASWSYGDISDKGYIKGKIIRLGGDESSTDYHLMNALAREFSLGVFTK